MNDNKNELEKWAEIDCDAFDFDELENKLESELEEQMADLEELELDEKKIGSPDALGETVMNVVWEQFINQVGKVAGEDFVKKNRNLNLDLRDSAHIQTTENFEKGNIADHNDKIDYQKRYDDWQNNFQRNEDGSIKKRYDRINGEEVAVLRNNTDRTGENYNHNYNARSYIDSGRPSGSASMHKDHTISAAEIVRDSEANAHLSRDEHASFANSDVNLVDLDASANESKGDHKMEIWLDSERFGQKPAERFNIDENELRERDKKAREEYEQRKEDGKQRSIETGKQSQKEEAFRIGGEALKSVVMGLLASLIKDIIRKLIAWFRSGNRKLATFIDSVKEAIKSFISNMKEHLLNAGNTLGTTIATAIFGPVISTIKNVWMFLKQGYKSIKESIKFLKNPANKNLPFSLKMMEVGKFIIGGLTAGGAIALSGVIEKGLMAIPGFAFEIPLLGSLASLIGMFLGAIVSGLIGALALNLIDRMISKKLKSINEKQQIDKRNDIIATQEKLIKVADTKVEVTKEEVGNTIKERHAAAAESMKSSIERIKNNSEDINWPLAENAVIVEEDIVSENEDSLNKLFSDLNDM